MRRSRRFLAAAVTSLSIGTSTAFAAEPNPCPPATEICPPGPFIPEAHQYCPPVVPFDQMPGLPPVPGQPPVTPSQPMAPQAPTQPSQTPSTTPQQPAAPQTPSTQPPAPQPSTQPSPQTAPQTAPPTFTPSSPTTAATSPQSTAPNLIGDLFGTGVVQKIVIQSNPFLRPQPTVLVPFAPSSTAVSFVPFGTSTASSLAPNFEISTSPNVFTGTDHNTGLTFSQTVGATTFTSLQPTAMINGGLPLTEHVGPLPPNVITNPSASGTFITLDQGGAAYQQDIVDFYTRTKPGLAAQQATYTTANGPGTFVGQSGESVALQNAVATLRVDNPPTGPGIVGQLDATDEFYHQQEVVYTPGTLVFQPDPVLFTPPALTLHLPNLAAAPGANVGRLKLSENTSPMPRDRVFFNYSYFDQTQLSAGGINVHRYTPGFEKTFFDGMTSVELRVPFASTISSDQLTSGITNNNETEVGNVTAYWKVLLWQDCTKAISGGVGLTYPTANDVSVRLPDGTPLLAVDNEAVHLLPFVGMLCMPEPRMFLQGFCQFDVDTGGNQVRLSEFSQGLPTGGLRPAGRPNDAAYMFVDFGFGYWCHLNPAPSAWLSGFAPTVELHYNRTIDEADDVRANLPGVSIQTNAVEDIDLFNGVIGGTALIRQNATLTFGYALPLGNNDDQFDGEVRILFNWLFGGTDRFSRVQF